MWYLWKMGEIKKDMIKEVKVIYEDNHILVAQKPPNVPSQGDKTGDIDMLTIIKEYLKEKYQKPGNVYLGLVHRLDRPVGGVMVFAKTSKAAARLSEEVRQKSMQKEYLTVVDGRMEEKQGILEDYLLKNQRNNMSQVVKEGTKHAKYAKLEYEELKYREDNNISLLRIKLYTGRHHQIRLQLASRGHGIYGDQKYGTRGKQKQIALWAYRLSFVHPTTKERLEFTCLPEANGTWSILKDVM